MIRDWLTPDKIKVINSIDSWENAVRLAAEPLLMQGYIAGSYIEAILQSHKELGPYYVLAPGLAMPHARPECGALKTGMSLTLLKQEVKFADDDEGIRLLIGLSAANADSHIGAIQALSELLCEEEALSALLAAKSEKQLADIIARA